MSKETLKMLRLIVPGILIFLLFYPLWRGTLDFSQLASIDTKTMIYIIIVAVAGGIYKTLELRGILFKERLDEVHEHIKEQLLKPFISSGKFTSLQSLPAAAFLKVFYNIVDNDESLTAKTKDIFENGLLWSSYSDLGVVSLLGIPLYFGTYAYTHNIHFVYFGFLLVGLFILSIPFIFLSVNKHKKLGNDQLEIITSLHKSRLEQLLSSLETSK